MKAKFITFPVVMSLAISSVQAGTVGDAFSEPKWLFGAHALYLMPEYDNFDYVNSYSTEASLNQALTPLSRKMGWGFSVEALYQYSKNSDIAVNWYFLDYSVNQTIMAQTLSANPVTQLNQLYSTPQHLHTSWDGVDVEGGQSMALTDFSILRLNGGLHFAHIDSNYRESQDFHNQVLSWNTQYNGVGPQMGMDLMYMYGNLTVYSHAAMGLLLGQSQFNTLNQSFNVDENAVTLPYTYSGSRTHLVPEVGLKLGAAFHIVSSSFHVWIDGGWMLENYFSALSSSTINGGPVYGWNEQGEGSVAQANFSVNGPYLGIKLMI